MRRKIRLVSGGLNQTARSFWSHPRLRELFPEFLFVDYSISRATTPLMEATHTVARSLSDCDPVAACLAEYLSKHIPEERQHDEWLLNDLEAIGKKREHVLERLPSPTAAVLVGAQYYWVFHAHAVSLLGYLAVMEGDPPSSSFLQEVIANTGLPAKAFRTFIEHARLDPQHTAELDDVLDRMPLNERHKSLIGVSAVQTVHWLRRAFEELLEPHTQLQPVGSG